MKRPSVIRIRSHTAKPLSSPLKNPFHPYKIDNNSEKNITDTLITLPNPIQPVNNTFYSSSFNYDHGDLKTYASYLINNNKRGLRSDEHFNTFRMVMTNSSIMAKKDTIAARKKVKEIENKQYKTAIVSPKKKFSIPENQFLNQKNFEKKIKNLSEKQNNKTTLLKIKEVLRELYEEKKKTKKIIKYAESHKSSATKAIRLSSPASKPKTKHNDSFANSNQSNNILESYDNKDINSPYIPKAVTKALDQLKNFIIDVPLMDEDEEMNNKMMEKSPEKENHENVKTSYFRKSSKVLPGGQYNNEKHLKEDFKMFKGKEGNKLIRKFTEMANEEAHDKEMNYYLTLLRLKNVGVKSAKERNEVVDFNDELRKIYKREGMIRSHGKSLRRKFRKLKGEMDEVNKKHFTKDQMDKLEIKIHKGLMNDYRKEKKKEIADLVEKMRPLKHKNTL
jgi:hypothetical protein